MSNKIIKDVKKVMEPQGFKVLEGKEADDFVEWFLRQGDKK